MTGSMANAAIEVYAAELLKANDTGCQIASISDGDNAFPAAKIEWPLQNPLSRSMQLPHIVV